LSGKGGQVAACRSAPATVAGLSASCLIAVSRAGRGSCDQRPGWRVRRRRLPGTRVRLVQSPPPARSLQRGSYASHQPRPAPAGKKIGAAPRGSRAPSMNAPRSVACQGPGRAPVPRTEPLVRRIQPTGKRGGDPSVDGHQDLPGDGREVDAMAITESDRIRWSPRGEFCSSLPNTSRSPVRSPSLATSADEPFLHLSAGGHNDYFA